MGNTFGKVFRISTYGESHGKSIGVIIDGCPPGIKIDKKHLQDELERRKPGQSKITTPRKEDDSVEILSGIFSVFWRVFSTFPLINLKFFWKFLSNLLILFLTSSREE